jgi:transposase-like protein
MIQRKTHNNSLTVQRSKSESIAVDRRMQADPKCPSCGHTMRLARTAYTAHPAQDHNVFRCPYCEVTYLMDDHTGVNGHEPNFTLSALVDVEPRRVNVSR